jgi:FKBP-type peptidyl-prolyl cis-trans isomerase 2
MKFPFFCAYGKIKTSILSVYFIYEQSVKKRILMVQAKTGDTVKVHYTGKLDDGTIFDSSYNNKPIEFIIGNKKLIPDFEQAVLNMQKGEKKTITISSNKAYGPIRKELILKVERTKIPANINPKIGQILKFQKEAEGKNPAEVIAFGVIGITDTHLTLDANHPLAGKDLTFEIELVEIVS